MRPGLMAAAICGVLLCEAAPAAEIKVLASGAVKEIYDDLAPQFERSTGHKLVTVWSSTVKIRQQVASGDSYDLVIVAAPEIDKFIKDGRIVAGSSVAMAKSGIGVAVKAGAPKPDISSGDAVKRAVLAAKSVAYSTGPSGVYIQALFVKLGIADVMKPKSKQTVPGSRVGEYLARGDAEIGFQQISELIHETGIDFLGPLPPDIQNNTVFAIGITSGSKVPDAAKALQRHLTAPAAAPAIKKNGMEPFRS